MRDPTIILGVNAFHGDSAACVLTQQGLVAAAEEERFRRVKHWAGFPAEAVRFCRDEVGIALDDLDVIAINRDPRANFPRKVVYVLRKRPSASLIRDRFRNQRRVTGVKEELTNIFGSGRLQGKVRLIEHHRAHLASSFFGSPFEEAVILSVDGFGDFASAAWGTGTGKRIAIDGRVYFPHSLGILYQAMTQYLGFPKFGDEYKVMGLASYGEPRFLLEMEKLVRLEKGGGYALNLDHFRHHVQDVSYEWDSGAPTVEKLYTKRLETLLGPERNPEDELTQRHFDIARSVQARYEDIFLHMLRNLHHRYGFDRLALSGGCAMNSVANGKIIEATPFREVYVDPAPGDAGGAIGAALAAWYEVNPAAPRFEVDRSFWGPSFDDRQIGDALNRESTHLESEGCSRQRIEDERTLFERVASAIAEGSVVGWFQGRMEFGPRALGNRSILADPRRDDMRDLLNVKIKHRERFRPFAPSILREAFSDWFVVDDDSPFMSKVYPIRPEKRSMIPAVTHVDGSGRPQTVEREVNPLYYDLIRTFAEKTGVPMLLNTSFNENEPIICRPEEALDCFLRTKMDMLVMGMHVVVRNG